MTLTYGALHEPKKARKALAYGLAATTGVMVLAFVLPDNIPATALPMAYTMGVFQTAKQLQGPAVTAHRARGGKIGPWGFVIGVGFVCLAIVFGVIAGISFLFQS